MNLLWYMLWSETLIFTNNKASAGHQAGTCDDTKCEFPFEYDGHIYSKCTTFDNDYAWCITNAKIFYEADESWKFSNGSKAGWSYCSRGCEIEHKICKECEASFVFDGKRHFGCTKYREEDGHPYMGNNTVPESKEWSWCVTNNTEFNEIDWGNSDPRGGWEYCSDNCTVSNHISIEHEPCNDLSLIHI